MSIWDEYNSNDRNQARLHEVSIDTVSGIQTFIDNSAKSPNVVITSVEYNKPNLNDSITVDAIEAQPSVAIKSILQQSSSITEEQNKINQKVSSLSDKQVKVIGVTFLGIITIIILIAIFK